MLDKKNKQDQVEDLYYSLVAYSEATSRMNLLFDFSDEILKLNDPRLSYLFMSNIWEKNNLKHAQVIIDHKAYNIMFLIMEESYSERVWSPFWQSINESNDSELIMNMIKIMYSKLLKEADILLQYKEDVGLFVKIKTSIDIIVNGNDDEKKLELVKFLKEKQAEVIQKNDNETREIGKAIVSNRLDFDDLIYRIYNSFVRENKTDYIDRLLELVPVSKLDTELKIKKIAEMKENIGVKINCLH